MVYRYTWRMNDEHLEAGEDQRFFLCVLLYEDHIFCGFNG